MLRRPRIFLCLGLSLAVLCSSPKGQAIRLIVETGFGGSTSKNEETYQEGPLIQSYTFDYDYDSRNTFGLEHVRSLNISNMSTSMSYSGLVYKFYINGSPGPYSDLSNMKLNAVEYRDLCLYFGGSVGFAQSSAPPKDGLNRGAAGIYLSPKAGMDLAMSQSWGIRSELILQVLTVGTGSLTTMGLGGGFYLSF